MRLRDYVTCVLLSTVFLAGCAGKTVRYETIHDAARAGDIPDMQEHLRRGVSVDSKPKSVTPLYIAAQAGYARAVEFLLEQGADPEGAGSNTRPLNAAAHSNNIDAARVLLKWGAVVDARSDSGETPLFSAVRERNRRMVELLISHGADVNVADYRNRITPLHEAVQRGLADIAGILLRAGANPDAAMRNGRTALHIAAQKNWFIIPVLVEHGADVNARDDGGRTPLHEASYQDVGVDSIPLLLEGGADIDALDRDSRTPLHYAADQRKTQVVSILLENGANPSLRDREGRRPADLAHGSHTQALLQSATPGEAK